MRPRPSSENSAQPAPKGGVQARWWRKASTFPLVAGLSIWVGHAVVAQVAIEQNDNADDLAGLIEGEPVSGATIGNSNPAAFGTFQSGGLSGVVISSGAVEDLEGSQSDTASTAFPPAFGDGNAALDALLNEGEFSADAAVLTYNVPNGESSRARFAVGTEESAETVDFLNDAVLLLIDGEVVAFTPPADPEGAFTQDSLVRAADVLDAADFFGQDPGLALDSVQTFDVIVPGADDRTQTVTIVVADVNDEFTDTALFILVDVEEAAVALQEEAIEATSEATVSVTIRNVVSIISRRIAALRGPGGPFAPTTTTQLGGVQTASAGPMTVMSGLSGGEVAIPISVWADFNWSHIDNDSERDPISGNQQILTVGVDALFADRFVAGASIAGEHANFDLEAVEGERRQLGAFGTLYGAVLLTDWLDLSAFAGYGKFANDSERDGAEEEDFDSDRWLAGTELRAYQPIDQFDLTGRVGYAYAHETLDSFTDSTGNELSPGNTNIGRISVGGEVGYWIETPEFLIRASQPFAGITYEFDHVGPSDADDDGIVLNAGWRGALGEQIQLGVEGSTQLLREDEDVFSIGASFRFTF